MIRIQQHQQMQEQEKQMIQNQSLSIIQTNNQIWCPICRRQHDKSEMGYVLGTDEHSVVDKLMEGDENNLAPPGEEGRERSPSPLSKNPIRYT